MENDSLSDALGFAWRDLLTGIGGVFLLLLLCAMFFMNDPSHKDDSIHPPGSLNVNVFWPEGDIDVDTWLSCPGDKMPVGYTHKSDKVCNLLRDDMGNVADLLLLNYEYSTSRGLPEGDYTINVFCFKCDAPVDVIVKVEQYTANGMVEIVEEKVTLEYKGDQITVVGFHVDKDGKISNINHVQKDLVK